MNFENVSTDELFTELMKRLRKVSPSPCYFIDRSTSSSNLWNIHTVSELGKGEFINHIFVEVNEVIE